MINYYKVLGVKSDASPSEIKSSFRRMAHKHHPDRNPPDSKSAEQKMKLAIEAYRVLSDKVQRFVYDRNLGNSPAGGDPYRERLSRGKHHPPYRASLILYDLLDGRTDEALFAFEEGILENGGFKLRELLPLKDWLDCTVLLAEQYEARKRFAWALDLYEEVFCCSDAKRRYRGFFYEIRDRMRDICCREMTRGARCEEATTYYRRALKLDLPKVQEAFVHKKMAERYKKAGRTREACVALRAAFDLNPGIKGTDKICRALCFVPESSAATARQ